MLRQPNDKRSKLRQAVVTLFCLGLMAYFGHHAVYGRHGLEARTRLIERSSLLAFETRSLEAVRAKLERDVALLSPTKPHPDLIEEVARDVLGFVKSDDIVIVRAQF